jgi:predicted alpha/beta hydrolase family esterase
MALIVGVHGIAQQLKGSEVLDSEWWPSLRSGVSAAKRSLPDGEMKSAFYGSLFRSGATIRGTGEPDEQVAAIDQEFDEELLHELWVAAANAEPERVVAPAAAVRGTPALVQKGLTALSRSKFFTGIAEKVMFGDLKQVRRYLNDPEIRDRAQQAVDEVVTAETRVIVAHSLGSVVAFEALHRFAGEARWSNVKSFVTLGSPLGITNLIFPKLVPAPVANKGQWPLLLQRWTNLSADNDVVALQKKLAPMFDARIVDLRIDNEARAHDVSPYLTDAATGKAIADAFA